MKWSRRLGFIRLCHPVIAAGLSFLWIRLASLFLSPSFAHIPPPSNHPLGFSLFLSRLIGFPAVREWIGNRGRATWCPWTSPRWRSEPWEPGPAGGADRWRTERRAGPRNERAPPTSTPPVVTTPAHLPSAAFVFPQVLDNVYTCFGGGETE